MGGRTYLCEWISGTSCNIHWLRVTPPRRVIVVSVDHNIGKRGVADAPCRQQLKKLKHLVEESKRRNCIVQTFDAYQLYNHNAIMQVRRSSTLCGLPLKNYLDLSIEIEALRATQKS